MLLMRFFFAIVVDRFLSWELRMSFDLGGCGWGAKKKKYYIVIKEDFHFPFFASTPNFASLIFIEELTHKWKLLSERSEVNLNFLLDSLSLSLFYCRKKWEFFHFYDELLAFVDRFSTHTHPPPSLPFEQLSQTRAAQISVVWLYYDIE